MPRALFVIDIQVDFCEGGALAVEGGSSVARKISEFLAKSKDDYDLVVTSRDWHDAKGGNAGHFANPGTDPNFVTSWPVHCVAGTEGANYHPNLDISAVDVEIFKGQGSNGYSIFEGVDSQGKPFEQVLEESNIDSVDVVGIATDHCVRASALDARKRNLSVRVITSLTAGVDTKATERAIDEMVDSGIQVIPTA